MPVGPLTTGRSWLRGLTECGPLEKGMANHFSILALRTPWTVWTVYTYILDKAMAAHFSIFCLENTTDRGAWWATVQAVAKSWTQLSNWTHIHIFIRAYIKLASLVAQWWRIHLLCRRCGFCPCIKKISWWRKWQPTPVFLPGKSHGQKSLEGYSPWDRKELDMTYQVSNNMI